MFSNLNSDKPLNISQLNGKFLTSELEQLNYYLDEDKKFDEVRKLLLARLLNLQTKINHEWSKIDLIKKSELLFEMQEILYDMQLVEHAAKTPLLNITKILFSANPARCICRETSPAKSKPPKRRRSELGGLGNVGCSFGLNEEVRTIVGITKRVNREEEQRNSYDDWEQTSAQNSRKSSIRTTIKQPCQRKGLIVSRTPSGKFQSDRTTLSPSNIILQDLSISKNSSNRNEDSTETNNEDFQNNNNDDCLDELDGTIQISSDQDCPSPPTFYKNIDEKLQSSLLHCNRSPPWNGRQTSVECEIEFSPLGTRASKRRICVKGGDNDCGEGRSPRKRNREMNDIALDGEVRRRPAVSNDEPTYCLCEQVSFGDMICCDYELCSVEWFHFSCVNLKSKPKQGKRWFCPLCRLNDKPGSLKPELQQKLDQIHKLQGH